MTHEKKRIIKCKKKKAFMCGCPRCPEARLALLHGGDGGAGAGAVMCPAPPSPPCTSASRGGEGHAPAPASAAGSSRARLINHVVEEFLPTGHEYTSFFRLSVTRDPSNLALPPLTLPPTPPTRDSLTDASQLYPTLRTLRLLPAHVSSSLDALDALDSSDVTPPAVANSKYIGRCVKCTTTECPSKNPPPLEARGVRTLIAKYADRGTMTPRYKDASSGICKGVRFNACRRDAAVVASLSMTTLMEPNVRFEQFTTSPYEYPKRCDKYPNCGMRLDVQKEFELPMPCGEPRAVRDTDEPRGWPQPEPVGPEEPRRGWTDVDHQGVTPVAYRRLLYNEGITDSQAAFLPTRRSPSHHARPRDRSRESAKHYNIDGIIPYSHNSNSKYHQNCKADLRKPPYSTMVGDEHVVHSTTVMPYAEVRIPLGIGIARKPSPRPASLPRKVLMSEKDIEAYIQCSWRTKNKT